MNPIFRWLVFLPILHGLIVSRWFVAGALRFWISSATFLWCIACRDFHAHDRRVWAARDLYAALLLAPTFPKHPWELSLLR